MINTKSARGGGAPSDSQGWGWGSDLPDQWVLITLLHEKSYHIKWCEISSSSACGFRGSRNKSGKSSLRSKVSGDSTGDGGPDGQELEPSGSFLAHVLWWLLDGGQNVYGQPFCLGFRSGQSEPPLRGSSVPTE